MGLCEEKSKKQLHCSYTTHDHPTPLLNPFLCPKGLSSSQNMSSLPPTFTGDNLSFLWELATICKQIKLAVYCLSLKFCHFPVSSASPVKGKQNWTECVCVCICVGTHAHTYTGTIWVGSNRVIFSPLPRGTWSKKEDCY
jgi:hypothetical protein